MKDLKDILTIITPPILAYITYKQIKMSAKQKEIAVKVDGMTSKLVEAEKGKSDAEGQLKGRDDAKAEQKVEVATPANPLAPIAVKIVDQAKTVEVKIAEGDSKKTE